MYSRIKQFKNTIQRTLDNHKSPSAIFIGIFAVIGVIVLLSAHAATISVAVESETGSLSGCSSKFSDASASGSSAVKFYSCSGPVSDPSAGAGATLPLQYNVSTIPTGTVYVSQTGSDSNNGTINSPFATLAKAVSAAPTGGNVVIRGGTYRQGNITVNKSLKITAYPNEIPVFNGAQTLSNTSGWIVSGNNSYHSYTPMPVTDGSGISFTTCQNQPTSCIGKFPDQVWIGTRQLQQVATEAEVTSGKFYVDSTAGRIYLNSGDVASGNIEVSNLRHFISIFGANVTLSGFQVIRYSNSASDYGVFIVYGTADNNVLDNMLISDSAFLTISYSTSGTDMNDNSTIKNSTLQFGNWMGVNTLATNYFKLDHNLITNMNQFGDFTPSPQSGALKASRTWHTMVLNNKVLNNNSQGIWFDESNYMAEVAGNDIENNAGSGLFYEISDFGYIINNYIKSTGGARALKTAASSNLYIVNNTLIGGADPLGVYTDSRSIAGCSTYTNPTQCSYDGANQDTYHTHPVTMTWFPSVNIMVNNIVAYPTASGYCGTTTGLCVTVKNANATVPLSTIIHKADPTNNIPQTLIDGNVYANGSGNIVNLASLGNYTTASAFSAAAAGAPININGFETRGLFGNSYVNSDGSPTATLSAKNSSSYPVPTDAIINKYAPAGTTHYGVLWK